MQNLVLTPVPIDDLLAMFRDIVREEMNPGTTSEGGTNRTIINRAELIKRLDITEPTVIRYEKKGIIPSIRIGSAVRYDYDKVLQALETKKKKY